jgi:hypothetical protein
MPVKRQREVEKTDSCILRSWFVTGDGIDSLLDHESWCFTRDTLDCREYGYGFRGHCIYQQHELN